MEYQCLHCKQTITEDELDECDILGINDSDEENNVICCHCGEITPVQEKPQKQLDIEGVEFVF